MEKVLQLLNGISFDANANEQTSDFNLAHYKNQLHTLQRALADIKLHVAKEGFSCNEEEIIFFKKIKPKLLGIIFYHAYLINLDSNTVVGCTNLLKDCLRVKLNELMDFRKKYYSEYCYYKGNEIGLDECYFLRGTKKARLLYDLPFFDFDIDFSTGYDVLFGHFIAMECLENYIKRYLIYLDQPLQSSFSEVNVSKVKWTSNKTALVELMYALMAGDVLNNGNAQIKDIAESLGKAFDIDLGDFYRTFSDIRMRKNGRTRFLDQLTNALIDKMDIMDQIDGSLR